MRGPVSCRALIGRRSRAPALLVSNTRLVVLGVQVIFKLTALVLWSLHYYRNLNKNLNIAFGIHSTSTQKSISFYVFIF